jgi:hypothetical protein
MHSFSHENPILHVLYSSLLQTSSQKHDAQCSMLRLLSALLPRAANLPPPAGVTSYLGKLGMQKVILTFLKDSYSQRLRDRLTTLQTKNTWRVKDSRYASDFFIFSPFACCRHHSTHHQQKRTIFCITVNTAFLTHYCLRHHSVHHCFITNYIIENGKSTRFYHFSSWRKRHLLCLQVHDPTRQITRRESARRCHDARYEKVGTWNTRL